VVRALLLPLAFAAAAALAGCGSGAAAANDNGALPALTGRVVDNADLLPAGDEARLTARLAALEKSTSDQLVVVTVPSLRGETIESYGLRLGNGWGVGQKALDNGVLLIVAPAEKRVRIQVGRGLEGLLTDAGAAAILKNTEKRVCAGNAVAITGVVGQIVRALEQDRRRPQRRPVKKAA
jgi:uncharacterized protein